MSEAIKTDLHVVVFLDRQCVIAQCLEYDIKADEVIGWHPYLDVAPMTSTLSLDRLRDKFADAFIAQIVLNMHHGDPVLVNVPAGPLRCQKWFEVSQKFKEKLVLDMHKWFKKDFYEIPELPEKFTFEFGGI